MRKPSLRETNQSAESARPALAPQLRRRRGQGRPGRGGSPLSIPRRRCGALGRAVQPRSLPCFSRGLGDEGLCLSARRPPPPLALVAFKTKKIAIRLQLGYPEFTRFLCHPLRKLFKHLLGTVPRLGSQGTHSHRRGKMCAQRSTGEKMGVGVAASERSSEEGRPDLREQREGKPYLERLPGGGGIYAGPRRNQEVWIL